MQQKSHSKHISSISAANARITALNQSHKHFCDSLLFAEETLQRFVLMTNEIHSSYGQFLFHSFCLLYMFRTDLLFHHQKHGIIYCITQFGTIGTIVQTSLDSPARLYRLYCVIQYIMPCSWWWKTRFVRNMWSRQKLWIEDRLYEFHNSLVINTLILSFFTAV